MDNQISKNQLIEEINLIPEDKHEELYNLIYTFRMSLNQAKNHQNDLMQFAGCCSDMSEEDFSSYYNEIKEN